MTKYPTPVSRSSGAHSSVSTHRRAPRSQVVFCSHGSTMMLGEDSTAGRYWQKVGEEALARGVKGVVFMSAHWEVGGAG